MPPVSVWYVLPDWGLKYKCLSLCFKMGTKWMKFEFCQQKIVFNTKYNITQVTRLDPPLK